MPKNPLDWLDRLAKAVPGSVQLAAPADAAAIRDAEQRLGATLPSTYAAFLARSDGGRVGAIEIWPLAAALARWESGPLAFGRSIEDEETCWFDLSAARPDGEARTGQGDLAEPTGGEAPGFVPFLLERTWTWLDDQEKPSKRAMKLLTEEAKARGARVGGAGISWSTEDEAELPIQRLRGTAVDHPVPIERALEDAVAQVLGARGRIARCETRIDHPLVHDRGRAELAAWIEVEIADPLRQKGATAAVVRVAQAVWKPGLSGAVLGDVAWVAMPGAKGVRQKHMDVDPVRIEGAEIRKVMERLLARHLEARGVVAPGRAASPTSPAGGTIGQTIASGTPSTTSASRPLPPGEPS